MNRTLTTWAGRLALPLAVVLVFVLWIGTASAKVSFEQAVSIDICAQVHPSEGEVLAARTANGRLHSAGNGYYVLRAATGPQHYAVNGTWVEFDTSMHEDPGFGTYVMDGSTYSVSVLQELFSYGQIMSFSKGGYSIAMQPMMLEWTNDLDQIQQVAAPAAVPPVLTHQDVAMLDYTNSEAVVTWDSAYGNGTSWRWITTPTRLKKRLTVDNLTDLAAPEQYILDGGNPRLRLNLIFDPAAGIDIYVDGQQWNRRDLVQTFSLVEFRADTTPLWSFAPLYYWGSDTGSPENTGHSAATLERRGNSLYVSIAVPYDWLQTATFPVTLDTDISSQVTLGSEDVNSRTGYCSNSDDDIYLGEFSNEQMTSGFRFDNLTISSGATVNSMDLIYNAGATDSDNIDLIVAAEDVADASVPDCSSRRPDDLFDSSRTSATENWNLTQNTSNGVWFLASGDGFDGTSIIQELVDDNGGLSGAGVLILIRSTDPDSNETQPVHSADEGNGGMMNITYTAGAACSPDIANTPSGHGFGTVTTNSTYWANGSTPAFPLDAANATFNVTNSSGGSVNITIYTTNWTGGVNWTLAASPGADQVMVLAGELGDNEGDFLTLTEAEQAFITSLADDASQEWELKLETPTSFSDGVLKEATVTLTATCE